MKVNASSKTAFKKAMPVGAATVTVREKIGFRNQRTASGGQTTDSSGWKKEVLF